MGVIAAYLVIGIGLTVLALKGQRLHIAAAGVIFIMPLIWPLFLPGLIARPFKRRAAKRRNRAALRQGFDERMAACPPGYEAACNVYYAGYSQDLEDKKRFSYDEGKAALLRELEAGNLPQEAALRGEVLDMAEFLLRSSAREPEALERLLSPQATPEANYVGGHVAAKMLRNELYDRGTNEREQGRKRELWPDISLLIAAWEHWLKIEPSPLAALSLGSWHGALWLLRPEGADKGRAQALRLYEQSLRENKSAQELWCALYGCLKLRLSAEELAAALDAFVGPENGPERNLERKLEHYMPDYAPLPAAWLVWPVDYQDSGSPERILRDIFWPLLPDEEARLYLTRRLLPFMQRDNERFTLERRVRPLLYGRYARSKDLRWVDLLLELAEKESAQSDNTHAQLYLLFFRAESAFMRGDKGAATALLKEYRQHHHVPNLAMHGSFGHEDSWGDTKAGREFRELDEQVRLGLC